MYQYIIFTHGMVVNTIRGLILKYAKDSLKRGTEREDIEKVFTPLNLVVVAGYGSDEIPSVYAFRPVKAQP